jgi:hypothetical protein
MSKEGKKEEVNLAVEIPQAPSSFLLVQNFLIVRRYI